MWGPQLFGALNSLSSLMRHVPEWGQLAPAPTWLLRTAARIEAASVKGFDRRALAEAESMSERRLSADFKTQTGLNLRRYGQWVKMAHAIQFASRGAGFTDAGIQAGFADAPHFSRSLKSLLGSVPSVVPFERSLIEGDFFDGLRRAAATPERAEAA